MKVSRQTHVNILELMGIGAARPQANFGEFAEVPPSEISAIQWWSQLYQLNGLSQWKNKIVVHLETLGTPENQGMLTASKDLVNAATNKWELFAAIQSVTDGHLNFTIG